MLPYKYVTHFSESAKIEMVCVWGGPGYSTKGFNIFKLLLQAVSIWNVI